MLPKYRLSINNNLDVDGLVEFEVSKFRKRKCAGFVRSKDVQFNGTQ